MRRKSYASYVALKQPKVSKPEKQCQVKNNHGKNFHACCDCMKERCLLSKVAAVQQSARILLKRT